MTECINNFQKSSFTCIFSIVHESKQCDPGSFDHTHFDINEVAGSMKVFM